MKTWFQALISQVAGTYLITPKFKPSISLYQITYNFILHFTLSTPSPTNYHTDLNFPILIEGHNRVNG